jgi:hypothetical protein
MPDSAQAGASLGRSREAIEAIFESEGPATEDQLRAAVVLLGEVVTELEESIGECRREHPYAPLRFIVDSSGRRICCTHSPPHCSPV